MSQNKPVLRTERCPKCAERGEDEHEDNLAVYGEDDFYCYKCGHHNGEAPQHKTYLPTLIPGDVTELKERGITEETCQKYNVRTTTFTGTLSRQEVTSAPIVIYPIYEDGSPVKQKIRGRHNKKLQAQVGRTDCKELFGKHCFPPSDRISITVTEGENDAMCIHQATGWPAVSIVTGAGNAAKEIEANLDWLMQWRHVNLCFDQDDAGREAAKACVTLLPPTKARIVNLPLKDANDMIQAGRGAEIKKCIYDATIVKPSTLLYVDDIEAQALIAPTYGADWPWESMTKITYGRQDGDVILIAAAKGCGKTLFIQHCVVQQLEDDNYVGIFSLEQNPVSTLQRFVGNKLNKTLHLPDSCEWDSEAIQQEINKIRNKVCFYNHKSGQISLEALIINIRYISIANKCKFVVIDNLKKLATTPIIDGKRVGQVEYMRHCVCLLSDIAAELSITLMIVQHLNSDKIQTTYTLNPEKKFTDVNELSADAQLTWETGRVPNMNSIYGAGSVIDLVSNVIVLARDRMSEDVEVKNTLKVKFLQTRLDGANDGKSFNLRYDTTTGALTETKDIPKKKPVRLEYTPIK